MSLKNEQTCAIDMILTKESHDFLQIFFIFDLFRWSEADFAGVFNV